MDSEQRQPRSRGPRPSDVAWFALFLSLALTSPGPTDAEYEILAVMALLQIAEPRIAFFRSHAGTAAAIACKLVLSFLLIGVTGGIASSYYLILIVPVVAAATVLGAWGAFAFTFAAFVAYLSFLGFVDWTRYVVEMPELREIGLRLTMIAMVALLAHQLAAATREQHRRYVETRLKLAAAEEAARRSERLAAIGQLTAGLAHELRNPLGTMRASAEVLSRNLPADAEVARELAGYIASEVDRTNTLVTRLLDFAKPSNLVKTDNAWNDTIDLAIADVERVSHRVSFVRNYSPDVPRFAFDADLMRGLFFNLLRNAEQASPDGATVIVKTKLVNGVAEASVIDRGTGIDAANRESIFNPFFTTKANGTGLGLAIAAKIAGEHGGRVDVESEPGQGSVFRVTIPVP